MPGAFGFGYGFALQGAGLRVATAIPANGVATITGIRTVGQTLSAQNSGWDQPVVSFAYQWKKGGVNIGGATASTYVPVSGDAAATITVAVTATNSFGTSSAATSAGVVIAAVVGINGAPITSAAQGALYGGFSAAGTGGHAPYAYSVASGALPPGITLNTTTGAVSGTATTIGTYASIVLRATDADGLSADLAGFTITVSAVSTSPDFWVHSVDGDDTNAGTQLLPFKTLAKLQSVMTAGKWGRLMYGSEWREELDPQADLITIDVGGDNTKAIPNIRGDKVVTQTWVQQDAVTYPNEWSITWARNDPAPTGSALLQMWIDDAYPSRYATSRADLQANGGWYADNLVAGSTTVRIKSATNPNSNGKKYEITFFNHGLFWHNSGYTVNVTGPLEVMRPLAHYGCVSAGYGTVKQVRMIDAGIHHMVTEGALTQFCIASKIRPGVVGIAMTAYRLNGVGFSPTFDRNLVLMDGGNSRNADGATAFYAHSSTPGTVDTITQTGNAVRGLDSGGAAATTQNIAGHYIEDPWAYGVDLSASAASIANLMVRDTLQSLHVGGAVALRRTVGGSTVSVTNLSGRMIGAPVLMSANGALTLTNNSLVGTQGLVGAGSTPTPSTTYQIFGAETPLTTVTGYAGDYNVFFPHIALGYVRANFNGVNSTGLGSWQTATGQDAHSCWVKDADQVAGSLYAFWLGVSEGRNGPADGDYRINPDARVYDAAGTAYYGTFPDGTAITLAGAQTHYDWNLASSQPGPPRRFPVLPNGETEERAWLRNPTAWDYYPAQFSPANTGNHNLDWYNGVYIFNGSTQASWAAYKAATGTTFARASAGFETSSAGVMTSRASDVERIAASVGMLYEPAATNLLLQSQTLNTTWTKDGTTISSDAVAAPDGTTTADKIVEAATTATHGIYQQVIKASTAINYGYSSYFQKAQRAYAYLYISNGVNISEQQVVNLTTMAVGGRYGAVGGGFTGWVADAKALDANWGRYSLLFTSPTNNQIFPCPYIGTADAAMAAYAGNTSNGIYAWGEQLELDRVTSYIPTTTTSATRAADILTLALGNTPKTVTVTFDDGSTKVLLDRVGNSRVPIFPRLVMKSLVTS